MKATYKNIALFRNAGAAYLRTLGGRMSKLGYAVTKVSAQTKKYQEDYEDQIRDLRAEHALIKDDCYVINEKTGEFQLDPKKYKDFNKKIKILNDEEVDVTPFIVEKSDIPANLGIEWYEWFIPFVIADYPEPVEEEKKEVKE